MESGGSVVGLSSDWKLNAKNDAQRILQHAQVGTRRKKVTPSLLGFDSK